MKAQFIVTIEGDWHHGGKPVTVAVIERELRKASKEKFEFLASSVTVKRVTNEAEALGDKGGNDAA